MVGKGVADPILDHIGFLLQNGKASSSMIHMVPHLDLQGCGLAHDVQIIRLYPQCVLHALGCLEEIFSLLVDGAAGVPAEQTFHLALHQGQLCHLKSLCLFVESEQEERLEGVCFWMVGMDL